MKESKDGKPYCPICGAESKHHLPAPAWGEMRCCASCGFVFANPLTQPEDPEALFQRAYVGDESRTSMHQFHNRILYQEMINKAGIVEASWMYSSAELAALRFLETNFTRGSVVFDIGCGLGKYLEALSRRGFKAYGLDVSEELVELLRRRGFPVWQGTVDKMPHDWVRPQVCTSFGVMHHLSDPVGFLKTIRTKFPQAVLLINESDYLRGVHIHLRNAVPPRHMNWWGPRPLKLAMEKAGYDVQIVIPKAICNDWGMEDVEFRVVSALSPRFSYLLNAYYRVSKWIFAPLALYYRLRGWNNTFLAIGYPK